MHLNDVDALWKSNQELRQTINLTNSELESFITKNTESYAAVEQNLSKLDSFIRKLNKLNHLCDVDDLWCVCQNLSNQITRVRNDQIALFEKK